MPDLAGVDGGVGVGEEDGSTTRGQRERMRVLIGKGRSRMLLERGTTQKVQAGATTLTMVGGIKIMARAMVGRFKYKADNRIVCGCKCSGFCG